MIKRAFTGPSELSPRQQRWAAWRVSKLSPAAVWRSGCAHGIDTIAARYAAAHKIPLELYVPAAPHNDQLVGELAGQPGVTVIQCDEFPTKAQAYRRRNWMMLLGAQQLVAFVWNDSYYRSGEWMTINIAQSARTKTFIYQVPKGLT